MKLRVWLVCWLFTAAFVSPSSGWTQDTDMKQFRTILLKLKANKVDEETVNIISSLVTANLANYEVLELVTSTDIKNMASLEAEKQSIGCDDETNCLAELAGAMDARYVIFGDVGQLGPLLIVGLNLFDAREAKAVSRMVVQTKNLEDFPDKLEEGLKKFMKPVVDFSVKLQQEDAQKRAAGMPVAQPGNPAPENVVSVENDFNWGWVKLAVGLASSSAAIAAFAWSKDQRYDTYLTTYRAYRDEVQAGRIPEQSFTQQDYNAMQVARDNTITGQATGAALLSVGLSLVAWGLLDVIPGEGE